MGPHRVESPKGRSKASDLSFLRPFFAVLRCPTDGFKRFWLYEGVKKGTLYVEKGYYHQVRRTGNPDGGYGRGISELLPPMVAAEKVGAEEPESDGGTGI